MSIPVSASSLSQRASLLESLLSEDDPSSGPLPPLDRHLLDQLLSSLDQDQNQDALDLYSESKDREKEKEDRERPTRARARHVQSGANPTIRETMDIEMGDKKREENVGVAGNEMSGKNIRDVIWEKESESSEMKDLQLQKILDQPDDDIVTKIDSKANDIDLILAVEKNARKEMNGGKEMANKSVVEIRSQNMQVPNVKEENFKDVVAVNLLQKGSIIELKGGAKLLQQLEAAEIHRANRGNYTIVNPLYQRRLEALNLPDKNSELIRHLFLDQVSEYLKIHSASSIGIPACFSVHPKFLAVGTSRGYIVIFDHFQKFISCLVTADTLPYGSIGCMDICTDGESLIAGYQLGQVVIWSIISKTIIKIVEGVHDCKITSLVLFKKTMGKSTFKYLSIDVKGFVNIVTAQNFFFSAYSVDNQCLFDYKTGPIFAVAPLFPNSIQSHVVDPLCLVGMCNQKIAMIIALEPSPKVLFKIKKPDHVSNSVGPCICWRATAPTVEHKKAIGISPSAARESQFRSHPAFALGWGNTLQIFSITPRDSESGLKVADEFSITYNGTTFDCILFGATSFDFDIIAIQMVGSTFLSVVNSLFQLQLFDPLCFEEMGNGSFKPICTVDLSLLQLVRQEIALTPITLPFTSLVSSPQQLPNQPAPPSASFMTIWDVCSTSTIGSGLQFGSGSDSLVWFLGLQKASTLKVLSWSDRLNLLAEGGEWIPALNLAIDFYQGGTKFGANEDEVKVKTQRTYAIGLPQLNLVAARSLILPKICEILLKYVQLAIKPIKDTVSNQMIVLSPTDTKLLQIISAISIEFCVAIEKIDYLFGTIYPIFKDLGAAESIFLVLLEPYILNDCIRFLSPELMKAFVNLYGQNKKLAEFEQCILHMDVTCLDLNQVVDLCRTNQLYSALIYVCNKGMYDYGTPLECILNTVLVSDTTLSQAEKQKIGLKLLLYIKYSLTGRVFPQGILDPEPANLAIARDQILGILFPVIHPETASQAELLDRYKWIQYFLLLECSETFLILDIALSDASCRFSKQRIIDVLFLLYQSALTAEQGTPYRLNAATLSALESQLAALASKWCAEGLINAASGLFAIMMKHLVAFDVTSAVSLSKFEEFKPEDVRDERQKILLKILRLKETDAKNIEPLNTEEEKYGLCFSQVQIQRRIATQFSFLSAINWDFNMLLKNCLSVGFFKVGLYLCNRSFDFSKSFECFVSDAELKFMVFDFVTNLLRLVGNGKGNVKYNPEQVQKALALKKLFLSRLLDLININNQAAAKVLIEFFADEYYTVLKSLESSPQMQYKFLRALMIKNVDNLAAPAGFASNTVVGPSSPRSQWLSNSLFDLTGLDTAGRFPGYTMDELLLRSNIKLTHEMHELYVRLLCQFDRESVHSHVTLYHDFKIEKILEICLEFKCLDAAAELMERSGAPIRALELILSEVEEKLQVLKSFCNSQQLKRAASSFSVRSRKPSFVPDQPQAHILDALVRSAIALCQRLTKSASDRESEMPWFILLDKFILVYRENKSYNAANSMSQDAAELVERILLGCLETILGAMGEYIALPSILKKITDDHGHEEFREFRDTIQHMLESYSYEASILFCAKKLICNDLLRSITNLQNKQSKALMLVDTNKCGVCNRLLTVDMLSLAARARGDMLAFFACGHSYHDSCLGSDQTSCPSCRQEVKGKMPKKGSSVTRLTDDIPNLQNYSLGIGGESKQSTGRAMLARLENAMLVDANLPSPFDLLKHVGESRLAENYQLKAALPLFHTRLGGVRKPGGLSNAPVIKHTLDDF